jgi:aspartate aminotransferase
MPLSLSERCLAIAPSATLAIDARAKELAAQGRDIIGFGAGEPDYDTPEHIADAGREAINLKLTRYTPVPGTLALRQRVCEKFKRDNGLAYAPDEVIVSSGAKQSLYHALCAIIDRKSTRLNSSHMAISRMPSSA